MAKYPAPTRSKGKRLIHELEMEYRDKIVSERDFDIPDIRSGDVAEVTLFRSLSEGKFTTHTGIVIGMHK